MINVCADAVNVKNATAILANVANVANATNVIV